MSKSTTIATEGGHWYDAKTGEPRYTYTTAKGDVKPTTLREARKYGYVPSVTTVCSVLAKGKGFDDYKDREMWEATRKRTQLADETDADYFKRCQDAAKDHATLRRDDGSELHGKIERWLTGQCEPTPVMVEIAYALQDMSVDLHTGKAERSFASVAGYGGKVDWHNDTTVVDFKTKDAIEDGKRLAYDEHVMQLAAYAEGLGIVAPRCLNVFVGITDGKVHVHEWNAVEIARGLRLFKLALALWQEKNNYNSALAGDDIGRQTGGAL